MNQFRYALGAALAVMLAGCLEVPQHPGWVDGQYAGKPDNRSAQVSFHNDKLAWGAAMMDRTQHQNEYKRANP
ncbi:MAG: hypothetical protein ABWY27_03170 [Telluria sp.]